MFEAPQGILDVLDVRIISKNSHSHLSCLSITYNYKKGLPKGHVFFVKRATISNFWKTTTMLDLYVIYFLELEKISDLKKVTFFCVFSRGLVGDPGSNQSIHVMT